MFSKFRFSKVILLIPGLLLAGNAALAQPKPPSTMSNPLAQALVLIMILLALAIAILANVVNNAAALYREKMRQEREAAKGGVAAAILALIMLASPLASLAQNAAAAAPQTINGLTPFVFYLMLGVIAVEIIIMIALVYQLRFLIGIEAREYAKKAAIAAERVIEPTKPKESWWWRINKAADISQEQEIDLSHDYDGISELDNKMPPWWIAAFGITILFSVVYLYRYHVSH